MIAIIDHVSTISQNYNYVNESPCIVPLHYITMYAPLLRTDDYEHCHTLPCTSTITVHVSTFLKTDDYRNKSTHAALVHNSMCTCLHLSLTGRGAAVERE